MEEKTEKIFTYQDTMVIKLFEFFRYFNEKRTKEKELYKLRQTGSALEYLIKFQTLANKLGQEDKPLMDRYYTGLKDSIRNRFIQLAWLKRLNQLIKMAIKINNCQ